MSEQSLDKLIESIKSEAIESARKESQRILEDANQKAERIVKGAEEKKRELIAEAEADADAIMRKGESALRQAARDLNVAVRNDLVNLLGAVLEKEVNENFTPDLVKTALQKVIENIGSNVELTLSENFEKELANYIHAELKNSSDIDSITKDPGLLKGMAISHSEKGWTYEVTPDQVSGLLKNHLTGYWVNILQNDEDQ